MEMESKPGSTEAAMKDNGSMAYKKVTECKSGQTSIPNIKENGKEE